jgi:transposase-like protein
MDLLNEKEYVTPEKLYEQHDYSIVEDTLAKMNLNQGQQDVLNCFMNGMSYRKTASYLDIAVSTVFRRRLKIQFIYNSL